MKRPAHLTLVDADRYSALVSRCTEQRERAEKAEARIEELEKAKKVVDEQAEDQGLWFVAHSASEAYLQNALRRLHAVIEGDALMAALAAEEKKP